MIENYDLMLQDIEKKLIKNKNKAYTINQIANGITASKYNIKPQLLIESIKNNLINLPNNCKSENINNTIYLYHCDESQDKIIYKAKQRILYNIKINKINNMYSKSLLNNNFCNGINMKELENSVDFKIIIIPFIKKYERHIKEDWDNISEFRILELFNGIDIEESMNNPNFIKDITKDDYLFFEFMTTKLVKNKFEDAGKTISSIVETHSVIFKNNIIMKKIMQSMFLTFILLITSSILGGSDHQLYTYIVNYYYVPAIFCIVMSQQGLKKLFMLFLIYCFIDNINIIKDSISIFPYDVDTYIPNLRIFILSFIILTILLYFSYYIIKFFKIVRFLLLMITTYLIMKLKIQSVRAWLLFKIYKALNIEAKINDESLLASIVDISNKLLNVDMNVSLIKKDNTFEVSIFKIAIFFWLLQIFIFSFTDANTIGIKKYIIDAYTVKNEKYCNNINKESKIIKLKNGNVLLKIDNDKNNFILQDCDNIKTI